MPALVFDKCCGCIDLKTGCFIIGYLELVGEIILSLVVLVFLVGGGVGLSSSKADAQAAGAGLLALAIILLLVVALLLAFTITLLVGLHKDKRGHVKAYLIYSAIFLVLAVIIFFASLSQIADAGSIFSNILAIALHAYFFLVIRSQYHKMDDPNKGAIYNTA